MGKKINSRSILGYIIVKQRVKKKSNRVKKKILKTTERKRQIN